MQYSNTTVSFISYVVLKYDCKFQTIDPVTSQYILRSRCKIDPYEELTISYLSEDSLLMPGSNLLHSFRVQFVSSSLVSSVVSVEFRREQLLVSKLFTCTCVGCSNVDNTYSLRDLVDYEVLKRFEGETYSRI